MALGAGGLQVKGRHDAKRLRAAGRISTQAGVMAGWRTQVRRDPARWRGYHAHKGEPHQGWLVSASSVDILEVWIRSAFWKWWAGVLAVRMAKSLPETRSFRALPAAAAGTPSSSRHHLIAPSL